VEDKSVSEVKDEKKKESKPKAEGGKSTGKREKAAKVFLYPESYTLNSNKLLAPIPVSEVSINKIDQNRGY
jgi:hypothetical protein